MDSILSKIPVLGEMHPAVVTFLGALMAIGTTIYLINFIIKQYKDLIDTCPQLSVGNVRAFIQRLWVLGFGEPKKSYFAEALSSGLFMIVTCLFAVWALCISLIVFILYYLNMDFGNPKIIDAIKLAFLFGTALFFRFTLTQAKRQVRKFKTDLAAYRAYRMERRGSD